MRQRFVVGYVLSFAIAMVTFAAIPAHAEETRGSDAQEATGDESRTRAERIEALREAIRREKAALADDRERRRAVRDRLESVREDLDSKRRELRELERNAEDRTGEGN